MKREMLEEFIKYAKEQFGCDITSKESSVPDTFESVFGISFLEQDMDTPVLLGAKDYDGNQY